MDSFTDFSALLSNDTELLCESLPAPSRPEEFEEFGPLVDSDRVGYSTQASFCVVA